MVTLLGLAVRLTQWKWAPFILLFGGALAMTGILASVTPRQFRSWQWGPVGSGGSIRHRSHSTSSPRDDQDGRTSELGREEGVPPSGWGTPGKPFGIQPSRAAMALSPVGEPGATMPRAQPATEQGVLPMMRAMGGLMGRTVSPASVGAPAVEDMGIAPGLPTPRSFVRGVTPELPEHDAGIALVPASPAASSRVAVVAPDAGTPVLAGLSDSGVGALGNADAGVADASVVTGVTDAGAGNPGAGNPGLGDAGLSR